MAQPLIFGFFVGPSWDSQEDSWHNLTQLTAPSEFICLYGKPARCPWEKADCPRSLSKTIRTCSLRICTWAPSVASKHFRTLHWSFQKNNSTKFLGKSMWGATQCHPVTHPQAPCIHPKCPPTQATRAQWWHLELLKQQSRGFDSCNLPCLGAWSS